jgi:hypothetical protein
VSSSTVFFPRIIWFTFENREVFGEKNGISKLSKLFVNFVSHYQKLIQRHPPPSFHGETENMTTILSTITLILRICRNLCANVPKNQTLIRYYWTLKTFHSVHLFLWLKSFLLTQFLFQNREDLWSCHWF